MDLQTLPRLEDLRPVLAYLLIAGDSRAAGGDAGHLFVGRPDLHHGVQVGALERSVESSFRVLRRSKSGLVQRRLPDAGDTSRNGVRSPWRNTTGRRAALDRDSTQ